MVVNIHDVMRIIDVNKKTSIDALISGIETNVDGG